MGEKRERDVRTGYPGMKVSGKTSSLTSFSAASWMRRTTFLMVAALFMKTGAAWAAATLNLVSFGAAMALILTLTSWNETADHDR